MPLPRSLRALRSVCGVLALSSVAACSGASPDGSVVSPPPPSAPTPIVPSTVSAEPPPSTVAAPAPVAAPPDPATAPTAAEAALLRASSEGLTADLAPHLLRDENAAFSAASIALAFAMTTAGAGGTTRSELAHALHFDGGTVGADPSASIDAVASAGRRWAGPHAGYELSVANRLFGERSVSFDAAYLDRVARRFAAPLEPVDFVAAAEAQRVHINAWVLAQTHDRIPDLIPAGSVDASTLLVLVNAVYFHARWQRQFDVARTVPEPFTTATGEHLLVPTMSQPAADVAFERTGDGALVVELPYDGDEIVMTLVLPPEGTAAEAWPSASRLAALRTPAVHRAELHLPCFRIESTASVSLRDALEALGARLAWTDAADFAAMTAPGAPPVRLSDAFHRVFVEVNEEGTEAAAATAVLGVRGLAIEAGPPVLRFDRPFLFFLRERATGAILFAGRIGHPRR